jgi:hypothetical protein
MLVAMVWIIVALYLGVLLLAAILVLVFLTWREIRCMALEQEPPVYRALGGMPLALPRVFGRPNREEEAPRFSRR